MNRSAARWLANRSRIALAAGAAGAGVLALGTTASLGGFTASITNTADRVATGSLLMQENVTPAGGTATTCLSTASGSAITTNANTNCSSNKFGALTNAVPGNVSSSNVVLQNVGSVTANTLSLLAGACSAATSVPTGATATNVGSDTAGFCGKVDVTIEDDTTAASPTCVYPVPSGAPGACTAPSSATTLATLASAYGTTPLALTAPVNAGASRTYKFTVEIDPSATNADQALAASEPLTFTFGS